MYPDAEAVICSIIRDFTGGTVGRKVPNPRPASFVVVRRVGGPRQNIVADEPLLAIEGWAANDDDAVDLANLARAAIHQARGTVVDGTTIYRVTEASGVANLPDPASDQSRYTFTVAVAMRGTSDAEPVSA